MTSGIIPKLYSQVHPTVLKMKHKGQLLKEQWPFQPPASSAEISFQAYKDLYGFRSGWLCVLGPSLKNR